MTSAQAQCPECGHSPLNHKRGVCLVVITLPLPSGMRGERAKAHCGCEHYKPLAPVQLSWPSHDSD